MIIIPSIDLINGVCVRLKQGNFAEKTTYKPEPAEMAKHFKNNGAQALHIVDLDGAKNGKLMQLEIMRRIAKEFGFGVQAGGGVRYGDDIEALLAAGVERVVLGTRLVTHPNDIQLFLREYGKERLVFAVDFNIKEQTPVVAVSGWQQESEQTLWDILDNLPSGSHVLCTDIGKDGMQSGPNFRIYQACRQQYPRLHLQSSGGISRLSDIVTLKNIGLSASIIGKALYENNFTLSEAIACLNGASFPA